MSCDITKHNDWNWLPQSSDANIARDSKLAYNQPTSSLKAWEGVYPDLRAEGLQSRVKE